MSDQAASLRELKQKIDSENLEKFEYPEGFLATIKRPSPYAAIALIIPESLGSFLPPAVHWLPKIVKDKRTACFWDQANILNENNAKQLNSANRIKEFLKTSQIDNQIKYLPKRNDIICADTLSESRKKILIDDIRKGLRGFSEVWISVHANELSQYMHIIHATDAACITVPEHKDAILKCYEAIKNLRLSGYFSPIATLDFISDNYTPNNLPSNTIKKVSKQFLSLDLITAGVVLLGRTYFLPEFGQNLNEALTAAAPNSKDFLYSMSESIIYKLPGKW